MDQRDTKALHIAATTKLVPATAGRWRVPSQSGHGTYTVLAAASGELVCTCPDYEERLADCKHVKAVEITVRREGGGAQPPYTPPEKKPTYSQDWPAYNAAQTGEKDRFLTLLAELCATIPGRPQTIGRPRLPLGDMAFAMVYKTYEGLSARRFNSDLRQTAESGLIDQLPNFNSVLRYMRDPDLTAVLMNLVELSSLPLKDVEVDFAVDSSGFGTSRKITWFSQKHGREQTAREWVKCHLIAGVATHIVTAVEITGWAANDGPYLTPLVQRTAKSFDMAEVSADKGYSTKANADAIEAVGATPFIAFKSNAVRPAEGTAWARMYHQFALHRDAFLDRYHKRSNVETVFSMMKRKFGDGVLSRSNEGQANEVLCKVIAHNLCVLVHCIHELGLEPAFDPPAAARPRLRVV